MTDTSDPPQASRVTVTRAAPDDTGQRQIIITVDGGPFATLVHGRSATREVAPGHHRIRANNTLLWKTLEFDLAPGDYARFEVTNCRGMGTMAVLGMLGLGPVNLRFERVG
jgi:hypothetical protein